jgi:hypothetical protein
VAVAAGRGRAFLAGLSPLGFVALIVVVGVALAALARQLAAGQGFAAQQGAALIIVAVALLGAAIALAVGCVRALRRVKQWQQAGQTAQASAALWGLALVALIVALPLLLAVLIPQHPAPNLAP